MIIVTAPGSLGDVNPLLAIACGLRQAGHEVLFLAAERYLPLAQRAGLATKSLVTEEQFRRLTGNPQLWHPRHGARLIFREAVEHFLEDHYNWLEQHCIPGQTTLVSHVLDFAGRIYRDAHPQTKFVSVLPAPALLRSSHTPPRLSSFFWERWYPRAWLPLFYYCADRWIDSVAAGPINRLRGRLGLAPVKRILHRWWWSPDLVLGLFPEWYAIDPRDRLPALKLVGFPLADSAAHVSPAVTEHLQSLVGQWAGQQPIVFAPGTAHEQAGPFLRSAAQACAQLQRPGVLISSNLKQVPSSLPPGVIAAEYLPFSQLLPQASAIVHHGGVGTTSQALRAGVPQVVVPMAFDQFDNAERVEQLGCGSWLPMRKHSTARLVAHLANLSGQSTNCEAIAARVRSQPCAVQRSVELIKSLMMQAPHQ